MSPPSVSFDPPAPNPVFHAVCLKPFALSAALGCLAMIHENVGFWIATIEDGDHMKITMWDHNPNVPEAVQGAFMHDEEAQLDWVMDVKHPELKGRGHTTPKSVRA